VQLLEQRENLTMCAGASARARARERERERGIVCANMCEKLFFMCCYSRAERVCDRARERERERETERAREREKSDF